MMLAACLVIAQSSTDSTSQLVHYDTAHLHLSAYALPVQVIAPRPLSKESLPGFYAHPLLALRGRLAGLMVSQSGHDPWAIPDVRAGGVHTFLQEPGPLLVVDGVPQVAPLLFDGAILSQYQVLDRPVDLAVYGMQGGTGVLEGKTDKKQNIGFSLRFVSQLNHASPNRLPQVATSEEYRQRWGDRTDFGFDTDWLQEVTRNSVSQAHQLQVGKSATFSNWRTDLSYQNVNGVGQNSRWEQYTARFWGEQLLFSEKLRLQMNAAASLREGERDYLHTFFYATKFNPTAPTQFFEQPQESESLLQSLYTTSNVFLRNYFEVFPAADLFNPVAIQAGNELSSIFANRFLQGRVRWQLFPFLQVDANVAWQANDVEEGERNALFARFRGNATSGQPGGAGQLVDEQRQEFVRAGLTYNQQWKHVQIEAKGHYNFQRYRIDRQESRGQGFASDDFTPGNFEGLLASFGTLTQSTYQETHRLIGFVGETSLAYKDWLNWRNSYHYQGATRLGRQNRWAPFWGTDLEIELWRMTKTPANYKLWLHAGYGTSGNIPTTKRYASGQYDSSRDLYVNVNEDLAHAQRRTAQLGLRWHSFRFFGEIRYTDSETDNLLIELARTDILPPLNTIGVNLPQATLRNRTWLLDVGWMPTPMGNNIQWQMQWQWAYMRTRTLSTDAFGPSGFFDDNGIFTADGSGPGGITWPRGIGLIALDAPYGQLIGRQLNLQQTKEEGRFIVSPVFVGDALPGTDPSFGVIGQGLPKHSISWRNKLTLEDWSLDVMLRADLGHDLAHLRRGELEYAIDQNTLFPASRNYLSTKYDLDGVRGFATFTNYYVENADYLSFDYISLSYRFAVGYRHHVTCSLTAQNIALLTGYTGVDPSPRYTDPGPERSGSLPGLGRASQLAPGIDRRYFYPRSEIYSVKAIFDW